MDNLLSLTASNVCVSLICHQVAAIYWYLPNFGESVMNDVGPQLAVAVKGFPRGISEEVLSQYLFSQGGEIKNLKIEGDEAIVEFEDTSGMNTVAFWDQLE